MARDGFNSRTASLHGLTAINTESTSAMGCFSGFLADLTRNVWLNAKKRAQGRLKPEAPGVAGFVGLVNGSTPLWTFGRECPADTACPG